MATVNFDSFLDQLVPAEEVQKRVNERFDALFLEGKDGELRPYACSICDEILLEDPEKYQITIPKMKAAKEILSWSYVPDDRRKVEVEQCYSFDTTNTRCREDLSFLSGVALSPRASLYKKKGPRSQWGFSCCQRCHGNITRNPTLPRHAILNKNYVGCAPEVLLDLNEAELAFLSPVKNYGYCFTHTGGSQKLLKGTCTFMRVEKQGIANSIGILEDLGLTNHALVTFTGKMTKGQKKKAKERSTIRTEKIIPALHWLRENNARWKDIDIEKVKQGLKQHEPVVLDRSETVESQNANLEKEELFTVYYPDGATTPTTGGFDQPGIFKEYVQEMAKDGFTVEIQSTLEKKFTKDSDDNILLDACLLQYPHGIGGMEEGRLLHDESITNKSDLFEYFEHVGKLSQNVFQKPMFQLIMCSMISKLRILKNSRLQLRGKTTAENLAKNFDPTDVISCIKQRRINNRYGGTNTAKKYLSSVDACSKALPHTNEAAKAARGNGESMQHHFGMSSVFLTVTFDDENSVLMQVLSDIEVDDGEDSDSLSDVELSERAKRRRAIRLDYPGVAAMNFEVLFNILAEEVIGWDLKRNQPTDTPGFFGPIYALSFAVEEQGRKTLHGHMSLWIEGYRDIQHQVFFGESDKNKRHAKRILGKYHEHIATTELFPSNNRTLQKAWDHDCQVPQSDRRLPDVVCPQSLRILRNRHGHRDTKGVFATCRHCPKEWTYEDMVCDYLVNVEGIKEAGSTVPIFDIDLTAAGADKKVKKQLPKARMFGKVIDYQMDMSADPDIPFACVNAGYQHHMSCHVSGCFRCQKKGSNRKGHICGPNCECRCRLPDLSRHGATMCYDTQGMPWHSWAGETWEQPLGQVLPKRNTCDLFQNVCCRAVSFSKFSCNSNLSVILDGPIGQYMHKYQEKQNQNEETADYKEVERSIRKMKGERIHEDDRKEALRLTCRGAFAHNRGNVISACFASYLSRHSSRFFYSHKFQFCPLSDVVRLHNKQEVRGSLKYTPNGTCFFENQALDYLCRSEKLEDLCLFDCTQECVSHPVPKKATGTKKKKRKTNPVLPMRPDTGHYAHPSVVKRGKNKGTCSQGFKEREERVYARISQWMFPDTADFKGDIRTAAPNDLNSKMEVYAQLVLCLFMPHRSRDDITVAGSPFPCTEKLQEVWNVEEGHRSRGENDRIRVFTTEHTTFLQNLQNCRSNSLRYKVQNDPLSKETEPYNSPNAPDRADEDDTEEDTEPDITAYDEFVNCLENSLGQSTTTNDDREFLPEALRNFDFQFIRNKGSARCGWKGDLQPPEMKTYEGHRFVKYDATSTPDTADQVRKYPDRIKYNVDQIVKLHLRRNQPLQRKSLWKGKTIDATNATGSVKSVQEWAKTAFGTDARQRRAFEVLTAAFLLTFYEERPEDAADATHQGNNRSKYRKAKRGPLKLRGTRDERNLLCLLHRPGGSGKSAVVNAVISHAQDHCKELDHPFTNRTITVTAMSGVAATLLNGETAHSVLCLNWKNVEEHPELLQDWADTRLLIIDECSFAGEADFEKAHNNLKFFMQERYWICGGLDVVFAGDYSQLEPVRRDPIYKDGNESEFFQGAVNCYIELDGKWRFMNDPAWGQKMGRFRDGVPTLEDIEEINDACYIKNKPPTKDVQVASYTNKNRCAINAAIFEECTALHGADDDSVLEGTCVIFADDLAAKGAGSTYSAIQNNQALRHFYENVSECDINNMNEKEGGKFDPCLKIYQDCPVMFTLNEDVANGQANGSRALAKCVHMKRGEKPFKLKLDNGTTIHGMFASQVRCIELEHENEDIRPRRFEVKSNTWTFKCKMEATDDLEETTLALQGTAFPIISNNCTTGHKLQGCTVDSILVNDWHYKQNWVYVVLSRVKTMKGLYLRKKLDTNLDKYTKSEDMKAMIKKFADTVAVTHITQEEYETLETIEFAPVVPRTPELDREPAMAF